MNPIYEHPGTGICFRVLFRKKGPGGAGHAGEKPPPRPGKAAALPKIYKKETEKKKLPLRRIRLSYVTKMFTL